MLNARSGKQLLPLFLVLGLALNSAACKKNSSFAGETKKDGASTTSPDANSKPNSDTDANKNSSGNSSGNSGSNPDGSENGSGSAPVQTIDPAALKRVEELCAQNEKKTFDSKIRFESPQTTCNFSKDSQPNAEGNLNAEVEDRISARIEQTAPLTLPPNAVLCGLKFLQPGSEANQSIRYDDELILTFNSVIVASSFNYNEIFKGSAVQAGELIRYNWTKLRGQHYRQSKPEDLYCLGKDLGKGACNIPPTETNGIFKVELDDNTTHKLATVALEQKKVEFTLTTIGDNNPDRDCKHSALEFNVNATYVQLP